MVKVYKPVSDREVARRLSVVTINSAYYYLPIIQEIFGLGLVICERTDGSQGEWIEHEWAEESEGLLISNYECSNCGNWNRSKGNFCPNCGADMRGEK